MREEAVEKYLREQVEKVGGMCIKTEARGVPVGWPDRLVLLRNGRTLFVEVKKPKGWVVQAAQSGIHQRLRKTGMTVYTVFSKGDADRMLERELKNGADK